MERFKSPKFVAAAIVVILAVIVFFQNSEDTTLKVLFLGQVTTQKATALLIAFLAGAVTGALVFSRWKSKREKAKTAGTPPTT